MSNFPAIDGVAASRLQLPPGEWSTLLDGLCARFPAIPRERWLDRFGRGRVLGPDGAALPPGLPYRAGMQIGYYREVEAEPSIPFDEMLLHVDDDLVVVDKPHFLPVVPAGRFVTETLLARLVRRLGNPALAPLHRLDRGTAGLVLFSARPRTRAAYQALFRERRIHKVYEALAPPLPGLGFPHVRRSRILSGEPFFLMREAPGEVNSETRIEVIERGPGAWHYRLFPVTGRKHQLRVHMAAMGAPIFDDPWYPQLLDAEVDDMRRPLRLLARSLSFSDPLDGRPRRFDSGLALAPVTG